MGERKGRRGGFLGAVKKRLFPNVFFLHGPRPETHEKNRGRVQKSSDHLSRSRPIRFFASGDATKGRVSNREGGKKSCGLGHAIGPVRNHTLLPAIFFRVKAPDPLGLQTNNIVSDPIAPRSSWQIKKEKRDCPRVRDDLSFGCCCFKPEMRHNFVTGSLFRIVPRSGHSQAPPAAAGS